MRRYSILFALLLSAFATAPAFAGVSLWAGYGLGSLSQNSLQFDTTNSHLMGGLSWYKDPGGTAIRVIRGSFERTDIPVHGDNDLDYYAIDVTAPQSTRSFPFSIGFGIGRYKQAQAVRISESDFIRRYETGWGLHLALLRQWAVRRRWSGWAELEVHDVSLTQSTLMVTADVGFGLRLTRH